MKLRALLLVVLLLAGIGAVGWHQAPRAAACSCAVLTTAEHADQADLVAEGVVVGVDRPADAVSTADDATYTVELTRLWKGPENPHVAVLSALDSASCGLEGIEESMTIALFAQELEGTWHADLCGGTAPMSEEIGAELTSHLGEPAELAATAVDVPDETAEDNENTLLTVGLAVTGAALVVLLVLAWIRRRAEGQPR